MSDQIVKVQTGLPPKQGLYDPFFEHDACGTGFVVNIKGTASHQIITQALTILDNLYTRGACCSGCIGSYLRGHHLQHSFAD